MKVIEHLLHLILGHDWVCELHLVDRIHDVAVFFTTEEHFNLSHGQLLFGALLSVEDDADAAFVE